MCLDAPEQRGREGRREVRRKGEKKTGREGGKERGREGEKQLFFQVLW